MQSDNPTAAILVIGDEILSGRTREGNAHHLAQVLSATGFDLREIRVVSDDHDRIVAAVRALDGSLGGDYDLLFTSGGIGPTHDDITADAVAAAFGVPIGEDPRAIELLLQRVKPEDLNEARRRMARIPHGADLVENTISKAPGFWIGNVIVMAGVPSIMRMMLDAVTPKLTVGSRTVSRGIAAGKLPEGTYAAALQAIALDVPTVSIGSYPSVRDGGFHNEIVVRGKDAAAVDAAAARVEAMLRGFEPR